MFSRVRFAFCLAFTALLTSCAGRAYRDHEVTTTTIENSQAVVVLKIRAEKELFSFGREPRVSFDLAKIDRTTFEAPLKGVYYHVKPGFFDGVNPWAKEWEVLAVEPGFYVIDNISWKMGNTTYYTGKELIPSFCPVKWGGFEVKPGTVNYVGDLEFSRNRQGGLSIKHMVRFAEAQKELKECYPDLADRLAQTHFYPEGHCYAPQVSSSPRGDTQ